MCAQEEMVRNKAGEQSTYQNTKDLLYHAKDFGLCSAVIGVHFKLETRQGQVYAF